MTDLSGTDAGRYLGRTTTMPLLHRAGVVACTALMLTLTLPAQADAATRPAPRVAAASATTPGFVPVSLPAGFQPLFITSPTDGVAFVSGWAATDVPAVLRVVRSAAGGVSVTKVAIPTDTTWPGQVSSGGGRAYTAVYDRTGAMHLYDITTTVTEIPLPTAAGFYGRTVVADERGVLWYVGYDTTGGRPAGTAYRRDGSTWTRLANDPRGDEPYRAYATGGSLWLLEGRNHMGGYAGARGWNGSAWVASPYSGYGSGGGWSYADEWTFEGPADYTMWGLAGQNAGPMPGSEGVPQHGTCTHVVDGAASGCPAPTWGVGAAVRLGDGRVVLGGVDDTTAGANGGFAVVPRPGAAPVAVAGDNGTSVDRLAAAPTGATVWAVTSVGGTSPLSGTRTLQVMAPPAPRHPRANPPRRPIHRDRLPGRH